MPAHRTSLYPSAATLAMTADGVHHLRTMLREQIAGDEELMDEIAEGHAPNADAQEVASRLRFCRELAEEVADADGLHLIVPV